MRSKRITAIILSLVFVLSLIPFGVFAVTSYNLWIGDTEVTSTNLSGEGWSYDPETNTLTLQNLNNDNNYVTKQYRYDNMHSFSETTIQEIDTAYAAIAYLGTDEFNIYVDDVDGGDNSFLDVIGEGLGNVGTFGIYSLASLNISGIDRINVSISDDEAQLSCAMYSTGDITINGNGEHEFVVTSSRENSFGIWAKGNVTLETGWLKASGSKSGNSKGILANTVTVKDTAECLTAQGSIRAIDAAVINGIEGRGWNNYNGTGEKTILPVNEAGASPEYKKIRFYAFEHYGLWVGDTEVVQDILSGEGWSYTPSTNTLTLNNFNYNGYGTTNAMNGTYGSSIQNSRAVIIYKGNDKFNISVKGENRIEQTDDDSFESCFGICSLQDLTISGDGTLEVYAGDANQRSWALTSYKEITLAGGKFSFIAGAARSAIGIHTYNSMSNDCSFEIKSGDITAKSIYGKYCYAICADLGHVTVSGGKINAYADSATAKGVGIYTNSDATFKDCEVEAVGNGFGIACWGNIKFTIEDTVRTFSACGGEAAISSTYGDSIETYVINGVLGLGWSDAAGTEGVTLIPVSTEGANLSSYKKVEFPHVHDFTENTDAEYLKDEATCTEAAVYYKSCSVCDAKGTETFSSGEPNGHDFTANTVGERYLVSEADCTDPAVYKISCSVCGEPSDNEDDTFTSGEPKGHDYVGVVTDPTCEEAGYTTYTCSVCSDSYVSDDPAEIVAPTGHVWGSGRVAKEATESAEGEMVYTCLTCGGTKTEVIPKVEVSKQTGDNFVFITFIAAIALISGAAAVVLKKRTFGR